VLAELLNNACKYTPPKGEIILSVERLDPCGDRAADIVFSVANQVEIPAAELSRIFDKFYRVPNGDRWRQGGTGLGLALVQRLVTELGGSIQVESSQGWTTFILHL
ncbi:MAG: ATP-binding protein, partial [Leptolyngbyaceae cyanobacterium CAN_BIN12]|nr:ATP-binding protein [Leptolyngbyaceae cyanobacterium CAN_BIN12]